MSQIEQIHLDFLIVLCTCEEREKGKREKKKNAPSGQLWSSPGDEEALEWNWDESGQLGQAGVLFIYLFIHF